MEYFYFPQFETLRNTMSLREQGRAKYTLLGFKMAKLLADSLLHQFILESYFIRIQLIPFLMLESL